VICDVCVCVGRRGEVQRKDGFNEIRREREKAGASIKKIYSNIKKNKY